MIVYNAFIVQPPLFRSSSGNWLPSACVTWGTKASEGTLVGRMCATGHVAKPGRCETMGKPWMGKLWENCVFFCQDTWGCLRVWPFDPWKNDKIMWFMKKQLGFTVIFFLVYGWHHSGYYCYYWICFWSGLLGSTPSVINMGAQWTANLVYFTRIFIVVYGIFYIIYFLDYISYVLYNHTYMCIMICTYVYPYIHIQGGAPKITWS